MNILEALGDPHVFGALPAFRDLTTWGAWQAFLAAVYGLPMTEAQLETFRTHTGRSAPGPGGYGEVVCIVGRQSGKSQVAAMIATFEAIRATRAEGRGTWAVLVAQDQRSALRALFGYVCEPFELPMLAGAVVGRTTDTLSLETGVTLAAYPCRPQAVRGLRARVVVVDELAHFISTDGRPTDTEMLRALRPCLATTGGRLIVLSSPYAQSGALWELHRRHYGNDDSTTLIWQSSAPEMNPSLPADYLERMKEDDPEAYRSEVLGEFRTGISTFLDPEALEACVATGRRELPPVDDITYVAFADPSGGRNDAFTLAIAHHTGERSVIDCLRAWPAPFNPTGVVAEIAELLKSYRVSTIVSDRYGGEWVVESFAAHSIDCRPSELDRSRLYLEMLPSINAGTVELPDDAKLLAELRGLERRRGTSGRDRVDHRPGAHDDLANSVAGAMWLAAESGSVGAYNLDILNDTGGKLVASRALRR